MAAPQADKTVARLERDVSSRVTDASNKLYKFAASPESLKLADVENLLLSYFGAKAIVSDINTLIVDNLRTNSTKAAIFSAVSAAREIVKTRLDTDEQDIAKILKDLVLAGKYDGIKEFLLRRATKCTEITRDLADLCFALADIINKQNLSYEERKSLIYLLECKHCKNGNCNPLRASRKMKHTEGSESEKQAQLRQTVFESSRNRLTISAAPVAPVAPVASAAPPPQRTIPAAPLRTTGQNAAAIDRPSAQ
jgi:hypothetical protein